ncbi:MAG: phospho-sugar mutase [Clostridia bacterium]|nr:phospho-sugar mutase [Clostridia bacterium]
MYKDIYENWLAQEILTEEQRKELLDLKENEKDIEFRFGKFLEFGTAGMRGTIGMGTNMINVYTVRRVTQGLAEYIKSLGKKFMERGVVISYDTRKYSYEFASSAAIVLASNGIKTYIYNDVHPVPMLSFAVRQLKTIAGIMITASHNPKEDNGYKMYGEDGAQMSPENTANVVKYINEIDAEPDNYFSSKILFDEKATKNIKVIGKKICNKYYKTIKKLLLSPKELKAVAKKVKLVYTPVHGSGYIPVTTILKKMGINPILVPEQLNKDPMFSTVEIPNPEYLETLSLGIKMADFKSADVVLGTDPDCDRLGVAIRNFEGEFVNLSGNQSGVLLLDYILRRLKETGKLNKKGFVVQSFATTSLGRFVAEHYGVEMIEVPVGFKYIGEKIKELDDTGLREYIFGYEDSCGSLRGTHSRDKDAVVASMLFAEMVCYYNYHGIGIYERLQQLYQQFGYFHDCNISVKYKGLYAMKEMNQAVERMRNSTVTEIAGIKVVAVRDYKTAERKLPDGTVETIDCAKTNTIYYELEDGSYVCMRPSGTEPKLRAYYSIRGNSEQESTDKFNAIRKDFEEKMKG